MELPLGPAGLLAQISTLRFPPTPLNAIQYREVFNKLSALETFNYTLVGEAVEMTTPPRDTGDVIKIVLGRDFVTVAFDPLSRSADYAADELTAILKEVVPVLPAPVFIQQTHVLRKTIALPGGADAREFLMREVLHIPPERMSGWQRPYAVAGVHFIFPPRQMNELSAHDLKVESFMLDPRKVFIEDTANFLVPLPAGQWDTLKANLADANKFLDEYAASLLKV